MTYKKLVLRESFSEKLSDKNSSRKSVITFKDNNVYYFKFSFSG
jgi:hypothetical protein